MAMLRLPLSNINFLECRASTWDGAADGIITLLKDAGVQSGQVIAIDAHNSSPGSDAIISAHYSLGLVGRGSLDLRFEKISTHEKSWPDMCTALEEKLGMLDVVSITGSCNERNARVMYAFFNNDQMLSAPRDINSVQSTASSWNAAADILIGKLTSSGVTPQQVLWIDAHNDGSDSPAMFSAFYSLSVPAHVGSPTSATGGTIAYEVQNSRSSWKSQYEKASLHVLKHNLDKSELLGITSSCNSGGRSVTYVFYHSHPETEPKIALPQLPSPVSLLNGTVQLKVLSFNVWCCGGSSLLRTYECMKALQADVICLQEASCEMVVEAAQVLGLFFSEGAAILSRFPMSSLPRASPKGGGGKGGDLVAIYVPVDSLGLLRIFVANCHLSHHPYGPYILRHEGRSPEEAVESDRNTQLPALQRLLRELRDLARTTEGQEEPCILCGDFNAASHLDYAEHAIAWPLSLLCEEAGLVDTYSLAHPEHMGAWKQGRHDAPGITWSCLPEEEPHGVFDRIDFVYVNESHLDHVVSSNTVDSTTPGCNPWPSDHRAVLSELCLKVC